MKALELYLARDHEGDTARWTVQLDYIEAALQGIPNITTRTAHQGGRHTRFRYCTSAQKRMLTSRDR